MGGKLRGASHAPSIWTQSDISRLPLHWPLRRARLAREGTSSARAVVDGEAVATFCAVSSKQPLHSESATRRSRRLNTPANKVPQASPNRSRQTERRWRRWYWCRGRRRGGRAVQEKEEAAGSGAYQWRADAGAAETGGRRGWDTIVLAQSIVLARSSPPPSECTSTRL